MLQADGRTTSPRHRRAHRAGVPRGGLRLRAGSTGASTSEIDERYFRPAEVDVLIGDASKATRELSWEPTVRFPELVRMMVDADRERHSREHYGRSARHCCARVGCGCWPRDEAKLERVRALMAEEGLDALVVRAPDNVLYLTNFWGMKGYDACVFPREGEPVLICLEAVGRGRRRARPGRRTSLLPRLRRGRPAAAAGADARRRR